MTANEVAIYRKLQIAGVLMLIGILAEIISLAWEKPLAFILFVAVGGSFIAIGLVLYLYSLVRSTAAR